MAAAILASIARALGITVFSVGASVGVMKLCDDEETIGDRWDSWSYRRTVVTERDKPLFYKQTLWWLSSECASIAEKASARVVRDEFVATQIRTLTLPCAGKYDLPLEGGGAKVRLRRADGGTGNWDTVVFFIDNGRHSEIWSRITAAIESCYARLLEGHTRLFTWDTKKRFWIPAASGCDTAAALPHPAFDEIDAYVARVEANARRLRRDPPSLGFLVDGDPGTGKTYCAHRVAAAHNRSVYRFPAVCSDNDMNFALTSVEANSVLLIDDIDRALDDDGHALPHVKWTISGLLNVCDRKAKGAWLFLCTNYATKLDGIRGLTRPGRFDRRVHFLGGDAELVRRWVRQLFPGDEHAREIASITQARLGSARIPITYVTSAALAASTPGELLDVAARTLRESAQ